MQQNLPHLHSGVKPTITPGDPMSREMNQYKKGHSFAVQPPPVDTTPYQGKVVPIAQPAAPTRPGGKGVVG